MYLIRTSRRSADSDADIHPDAVEICDGHVPEGWMGLDIGPATIDAWSTLLQDAGTVVWNGPMGVFEMPPFDTGTRAIAKALEQATQDKGTITIVGGGETAAAVGQAGVAEHLTHVSTGGGASLSMLEGHPFPLAILTILGDFSCSHRSSR